MTKVAREFATGSTPSRRIATIRGIAGAKVNQKTIMLAASALAKTRKPTMAIFNPFIHGE